MACLSFPMTLTLCVSIVIFCECAPALATPPTTILASVDEAIARAHRHHPALDEYALRHEQASRQYDAVRYHWLPNLSTGISARWNGALPPTRLPGEFIGRPGETFDAEVGASLVYTAGLTLSQPVLDLQSWYLAESAEVAAKSAQASSAAYRQQLTEQVALNYYTAVTTNTLLQNQQESQSDAAKLVALVESRLAQGVADQSAVNRARINQNTVRQDASNYRDTLEQSYANLRILLGIPAGTPVSVSEIISDQAADSQTMDELGPDLNLVVDELAVSQTHYQWQEKRAKRWPTITVDAYLGAQQLQNDLRFEFDKWAMTQWVSLNLSFPLFTGLSRMNEIRAAEAAHQVALRNYARKKEETRIIDENLASKRRLYRQQVTTTRLNHVLAGDNVSLALLKYEQGVIGLEQVLDAREDQRRAEAAYLNALLSYYRVIATFLSRRS